MPTAALTEILPHLPTGEVRQNAISHAQTFRYHDGFTRADEAAGWKQVVCFGANTPADDMTEEVARIRAIYLGSEGNRVG